MQNTIPASYLVTITSEYDCGQNHFSNPKTYLIPANKENKYLLDICRKLHDKFISLENVDDDNFNEDDIDFISQNLYLNSEILFPYICELGELHINLKGIYNIHLFS